jgi:hypothetical protein
MSYDTLVKALREVYKKDKKQELTDEVIAAGQYKDVNIAIPEGYTGMIVTVKASFAATNPTTTGVRIVYMYSYNGTDYDNEDNAVDAGNYEDILIPTGQTSVVRQRSFILAALAPHIKLRVKNLDATNDVTINLWRVITR